MGGIGFKNASEIRHAYIVCSQNPDECFDTAMNIAKAAVCRAGSNLPCGSCPACLKVESGSHPDIRVISKGEGKAKHEISVDQVRSVILDAAVLPNESERKVYIFRDGDVMNEPAQNAALKLLEEPPAGVILILCASRPENFLQTVRSRCVELMCNAEDSERETDERLSALAGEYIRIVGSRNALELFKFCEVNNGLSVQEMSAFATLTAEMLTDMLCGRRPCGEMSPESIMDLERLMEKCISCLKVNVGVKQLFGLLEVDSIPRSRRE